MLNCTVASCHYLHSRVTALNQLQHGKKKTSRSTGINDERERESKKTPANESTGMKEMRREFFSLYFGEDNVIFPCYVI